MTKPFILLVGGRSMEYTDSLNSYLAIREELLLSSSRYTDRVFAVYYIDQSGSVHEHRQSLPDSEDALRSEGELIDWPTMASRLIQSKAYVFSLLHGNEGEDGCYQGVAEILDIAGNFGSVHAASISMSKWILSFLAPIISGGLVECPKTWILSHQSTDEDIKKVLEDINGCPVVIKPNSLGSSILSNFFDSLSFDILKNQIELIQRYDKQILIQHRITGTEYSCGILETGGKTITLPIAQIHTSRSFFGYAEKHHTELQNILFLPENTLEMNKIRLASMRLFYAIGISNMCRLDFIHSKEDSRIYFLEANTLPGLGKDSIFPKMLRESNISRLDLIDLCMANYRYHRRLSKLP